MKLWDVATGKVRTSLAGDKEAVWSVSFSPDGKRLAAGSGHFAEPGKPGKRTLWSVAAGE